MMEDGGDREWDVGEGFDADEVENLARARRRRRRRRQIIAAN